MRTATPSAPPSRLTFMPHGIARQCRRIVKMEWRIARAMRGIACTPAQRLAVLNLFCRARADALENRATPPSLRMFVLGVQPTFACDGAIAVPYAGMWVCVERDGYTHT